ncbi:unnamed protein product [Ectocarpus sp. 4 AP-2014]
MCSTVRRRGTAKATMCRTCLRARCGATYNTWRRKRLGLVGKGTNAGAGNVLRALWACFAARGRRAFLVMPS